jgi:hypothetical protein
MSRRLLHGLVTLHWHAPGPLWEAVRLMARLVGNVADCGNSVEKYRCVLGVGLG